MPQMTLGSSGRMVKSCRPDQRTSSSEHISWWVTAPLRMPALDSKVNCACARRAMVRARYPVAFRASPSGVHCGGAPEWGLGASRDEAATCVAETPRRDHLRLVGPPKAEIRVNEPWTSYDSGSSSSGLGMLLAVGLTINVWRQNLVT